MGAGSWDEGQGISSPGARAQRLPISRKMSPIRKMRKQTINASQNRFGWPEGLSARSMGLVWETLADTGLCISPKRPSLNVRSLAQVH